MLYLTVICYFWLKKILFLGEIPNRNGKIFGMVYQMLFQFRYAHKCFNIVSIYCLLFYNFPINIKYFSLHTAYLTSDVLFLYDA